MNLFLVPWIKEVVGEENTLNHLLMGVSDTPSTGRIDPIQGCLINPICLVWPDAGASLTYQASQRAEAKEYSWTSQSILNFDFTLALLHRRLTKDI